MAHVDRCRACIDPINTANSNKSYNLLEMPELAHKFITCTNLAVEEAADFPCRLCQACHDNVESFYAFRLMCIAADERLRAAQTLLIHDEKPVYDLEMQPQSDITAVALNLGMDEAQVEVAECSIRKRRGRSAKSTQQLRHNQEAQDVNSRSIATEIVTDYERKIQTKDDNETVPEQKDQIMPSYQCDICPSRFYVEHRLVAHKRRHNGQVPYPCTEVGCERGFNRLHCLSEHLKQHAGTSNTFSCVQDGCNKTYKHKPTLVMHMRKCHKLGPEIKSHICEYCGKVFKSSAVLNDHRYTHKEKSELPHACQEPDCTRRFSSKEKLKVHMMRHAGIKNFFCPYCGVRKVTRNELKIHMNYHTLERTWPCRFCAKVCNSAGNLKMHVRTVHERARDYACSYCECTFAKPDTRKYHEMTHTGEKPHECQECGKRFTQPAALRTHLKIHLRQQENTSSEVAGSCKTV